MTAAVTTSAAGWLGAARYAVETKGFVMVEPDGSWHPPTDHDWTALDDSEADEELGFAPVETSGVVLDIVTASMLVQIHDALSDVNRKRFAALDVMRAVDIGWKLVAK